MLKRFGLDGRSALVVAIPMALIAVLGFWIAFQFVKPAPPSAAVVAAGSPGGAYYAFAQRYRSHLSQHGIELTVLETGGSVDNLARMSAGLSGEERDDGEPAPDIIFLQGGIAPPLDLAPDPEAEIAPLETLAELFVEPLWLFYREEAFESPPTLLAELEDRIVAVGGEGSGTRRLVDQLLERNGRSPRADDRRALGGREAADALVDGEVEAAFFVSDASSSNIIFLAGQEGIGLMSFLRAGGIAQPAPDLHTAHLARGALDLASDMPPIDVEMVAPVAMLVAREDLHPAVTALILEATRINHGHAGLFAEAGDFPRARATSFPMNAEAERYLTDGPPFLQRYLPFWLAVLLDRMVVLLIPFIAVLLPLFRFFPPLYAWRMRSRVYRWYRDVARLEVVLEGSASQEDRAQGLLALDRLDGDVARLDVPLGYAHSVYQLRQHIRLVRDRLTETEPTFTSPPKSASVE